MGKALTAAAVQALSTAHEGAESVGACEAVVAGASARCRAEVKEQYTPEIGTVLVAKGYPDDAYPLDEMAMRATDEVAAARPSGR